MRRKVLPAGRALLGAVLAVLLLVTPAVTQSLLSVSEPPVRIDDLLRQGHQMEVDRRWGEALTHYEAAARQFPDERSLQRRFEFARLHYDLGRRYNDRSYREALARLSLEETLTLYAEVLLKIQAHYVEEPNWKELVERGTNSLEVALSEPVFLKWHTPDAEGPALDAFRGELRRVLGPLVVASRGDARDAVATAASLAQQRLGMSAAAVVLEYTSGATNALDPYSTYLTADQLAEVYSQIEGNFVGLGVELKADEGTLLIVRVIPGSPAQQAGILAGDRILAVDGRSIRDFSTDEAANLLQGEVGTVGELAVLTPGAEPRNVSIRRQRVDVPSIDEVQLLDRNQGVGYLKLVCFQKTTCRDLDTALWNLHRAGMKSLIVDLRGNPGGLLITSVEVADKFLEQGIIVSTRGRSLQEDFIYSAHQAGTWRVPLVVIIDHDSASAAEIFAGAIRDHRRGTIVGKRSYGKGSVQGIFPLNLARAGVRLTTARFYSPTGHPYSRIGVQPDIVVQQVARPINGSAGSLPASGKDPVLAAALQAAQQLVAQR